MQDELLGRSRCEAVFSEVVDCARAHGVREVEAIIAGGENALTRFANNAIHQNVAERAVHLSVRPVIDGRTAVSYTHLTLPTNREV